MSLLDCLDLGSYCYDTLPVGWIRLIRLLPDTPNTPLRCSLRTVNLFDFDDINGVARTSELPIYDALSYVWGDVTHISTAYCDDHVLQVTCNLESALKRFRHTHKTTILWADGICINQSSSTEKAQQVQLMGLIYWKAQRVHVWLGEDEEVEERWRARSAFKTMEEMSVLYTRSCREEDLAVRRYRAEDLKLGEDTYRWEAIGRLLSRSWFKRVWVVQELGLAKNATFYCGNASIDRVHVDRCTRFLDEYASLFVTFYGISDQVLSMALAYFHSTRGSTRPELGSDPVLAENFFDLMEHARGLECTDARDSVYAFLGHPSAFKQHLLDAAPYEWYPWIFKKELPTIVQPDYSDDVTVTDVYFRSAWILIDDMNLGLEVLRHVAHDDDTINDNFPSWVPRWNIDERSIFRRGPPGFFTASLDMEPTSFELVFDEPLTSIGLKIKAIQLGTVMFSCQQPGARGFINVVDVEDYQNISPRSPDCCNPVDSMYCDLEDLRRSLPNPQQNDTLAFATTYVAGNIQCADRDPHNLRREEHQLLRDFHAYCRSMNSTCLPRMHFPDGCGEPYHAEGDGDRYLESLKAAAANRAFFGTFDGRLGLGPRLTIGGDEVWLPLGSAAPFMLRPMDGGVFRILGETYLHGMMFGEALKDKSEDSFQEITLT